MSRTPIVVLVSLLLVGCRCGDHAPQPGRGKADHITKRDKVRRPQQRTRLAGAMILIAYKGARLAGPAVQRSRAEARQLARQLAERLKGDVGAFAELARKHSDGATAARGGSLGAWARGQMPRDVEAALDRLEIGEVSEPLEAPDGFRILQRQIAVLAGSQILIAWRGAEDAPASATRNKLEARELARKLSEQARRSPNRFGALARAHSDDRATARRRGQLGLWPRGQRAAIVEQTLDRLELDQVSFPVETPRGFLVLKREDPFPRP